jgi:hypothetical protein
MGDVSALVARVRACLKLIGPDHITPMGVRMIEKILDDADKERKYAALDDIAELGSDDVPFQKIPSAYHHLGNGLYRVSMPRSAMTGRYIIRRKESE